MREKRNKRLAAFLKTQQAEYPPELQSIIGRAIRWADNNPGGEVISTQTTQRVRTALKCLASSNNSEIKANTDAIRILARSTLYLIDMERRKRPIRKPIALSFWD